MVHGSQIRTGSIDARPNAEAAAPTLGFLGRTLGLRLADGSPRCYEDRPVRGVWRVNDDLVLPDSRQDLRDLVVVPPRAPDGQDAVAVGQFVRRLAERKAAALAVPPDIAECAPLAGMTAVANRLALPVLVVPEGVEWSYIAQVISDERCRLAQAHARIPCEVLAHLRTPSSRQDGIQQLADWLAGAIDGAVTVTSATGEAIAGAPAKAWEIMEPAAEMITRVSARPHSAAAVDAGSREVRLLPLGDRAPCAVLAVAFTPPFRRSLMGAVDHAADVLPLLLRVRQANVTERRTRKVQAAARVGVLQMLMGGQLMLAQRTASAMAPGLLDADECRVLILSGRPEDRDNAVEECVQATRGGALVVRCPVYDTNVIIVSPTRPDPGHWDEVAAGLEKVVAARPERCLGGSGRTPMAATADGYREASHALAAARHLTDRVVLRGAETQLANVLDQRAHRWAEELLAPLLALRYTERDQMLDILRLVLEFGVAGTARITGRHRNTVSATRNRAVDLLGIDLDDVLTRASLDLALRVLTRPARPDAGPPERVALSDLLSTRPVRYWAQRWLAALDRDGRGLRGTLVAWIACNTHVERAATRLGLYPDTVRDHLKAVDRLLRRDLMSPSGPHDLIFALLVLGAMPMPPEPAAVT